MMSPVAPREMKTSMELLSSHARLMEICAALIYIALVPVTA
jgi:hypothetical protein